MKTLILSLILLGSTVHASVFDSLNCKISSKSSIEASYDAMTDVVTVSYLNDGNQTMGTGAGYQTFDKNEIASDDLMTGLAQTAGVSLSKVDHASVFVLKQESDATMMLVKFLDADKNFLGASALLGWTATKCLK